MAGFGFVGGYADDRRRGTVWLDAVQSLRLRAQGAGAPSQRDRMLSRDCRTISTDTQILALPGI